MSFFFLNVINWIESMFIEQEGVTKLKKIFKNAKHYKKKNHFDFNELIQIQLRNFERTVKKYCGRTISSKNTSIPSES
jgi:hypothetical protein